MQDTQMAAQLLAPIHQGKYLQTSEPKPVPGQRQNESQKAVILDMIKFVGEIASKIWPVV